MLASVREPSRLALFRTRRVSSPGQPTQLCVRCADRGYCARCRWHTCDPEHRRFCWLRDRCAEPLELLTRFLELALLGSGEAPVPCRRRDDGDGSVSLDDRGGSTSEPVFNSSHSLALDLLRSCGVFHSRHSPPFRSRHQTAAWSIRSRPASRHTRWFPGAFGFAFPMAGRQSPHECRRLAQSRTEFRASKLGRRTPARSFRERRTAGALLFVWSRSRRLSPRM